MGKRVVRADTIEGKWAWGGKHYATGRNWQASRVLVSVCSASLLSLDSVWWGGKGNSHGVRLRESLVNLNCTPIGEGENR